MVEESDCTSDDMASAESVRRSVVSPEGFITLICVVLFLPQTLAMLTVFLTTLPDVAFCIFLATPVCLFHSAAQQVPPEKHSLYSPLFVGDLLNFNNRSIVDLFERLLAHRSAYRRH